MIRKTYKQVYITRFGGGAFSVRTKNGRTCSAIRNQNTSNALFNFI